MTLLTSLIMDFELTRLSQLTSGTNELEFLFYDKRTTPHQCVGPVSVLLTPVHPSDGKSQCTFQCKVMSRLFSFPAIAIPLNSWSGVTAWNWRRGFVFEREKHSSRFYAIGSASFEYRYCKVAKLLKFFRRCRCTKNHVVVAPPNAVAENYEHS